jgi:hypothetical protein
MVDETDKDQNDSKIPTKNGPSSHFGVQINKDAELVPRWRTCPSPKQSHEVVQLSRKNMNGWLIVQLYYRFFFNFVLWLK